MSSLQVDSDAEGDEGEIGIGDPECVFGSGGGDGGSAEDVVDGHIVLFNKEGAEVAKLHNVGGVDEEDEGDDGLPSSCFLGMSNGSTGL